MLWPQGQSSARTRKVPIRRMAMVAFNSAAGNGKEVPEVVEATLYLESATFVTGETLHVDGGAHAGHW